MAPPAKMAGPVDYAAFLSHNAAALSFYTLDLESNSRQAQKKSFTYKIKNIALLRNNKPTRFIVLSAFGLNLYTDSSLCRIAARA